MKKRMSREEFILILDAILQEGPKVRYQNPDAWSYPRC